MPVRIWPMPRTDSSTCWPSSRRRAAACTALLGSLVAGTGCRPADTTTGFSVERASKHVRMLGTSFGSRPATSRANGQARAYLVAELQRAGFQVRLQEALPDAQSRMMTPVVNVIAVRPGRQSEAVALVSHYDSPPESRGAADDGLGVAVCVEAGRVLAQRASPRYTLIVALTDGEELGLMGARALLQAPEFAAVRAYFNIESVGTNGPARLFQAGPGNSWLTAVWARSAPFPSGSSLLTEVYRRLPNDTDFSILRQSGAPGLNFAPTGNTFAYHTRLDTPARLETDTIRTLGDNAVRLTDALESVDIRQRTSGEGTYFDVAGRFAVAYSDGATRVLAVVAFVVGMMAAYKSFRAARQEVGFVRVFVTVVWMILGTGAVFGALVTGCYLLRLGTGLQQPWYGQANVFPVFLATVGLGAGWLVRIAGRAMPVTVRPSGHPACVWMLTLPVWAGILAFLQRPAPGAGYLFAIPLLTAGVLILALPVRHAPAGRMVSAIVAVVAGALWVPLWWPLLEFVVGLLGRMPVVTPPWLYPAFVQVAVIAVGPAVAGVFLGRESHWLPASAVTSLLLLAVVASSWVMAVEPAYSAERPERRRIRYLQDMLQQKALWEAGTHEAVADPVGPNDGAPVGWQADGQSPALSIPLGRVSGAFRYRARASGLVAPPLDVRTVTEPIPESFDSWLETVAVPRLEGTGVTFMLPTGVTPVESNLPGLVIDGRWRAAVIPAPPGGIALRVRLTPDRLSRMADGRVVATVYGVPGGIGWQRLPPWLPQETIAWDAQSYFVLPWPTAGQ
jgi:hypothetical protein